MTRDGSLLSRLTLAVAGLGFLLHLYTGLFKAEGGFSAFLAGLVVASWVPYAIAALLTRWPRWRAFALGAALACLAADLYVHYTVFVAPQSSTAALGLLVMPVYNLLAIGPVGGLLAWGLHRAFGRR